MATPPRWVKHPQTAVSLPIDSVTDIVTIRLEEATRYREECEQERNHSRAVADARQRDYEAAHEQERYWERILTEIKDFEETGE